MADNIPSFIDRDAQVVLQDIIAKYEAETGKPLQPAQVERLVLNTFAYREVLLREQIQAAALMNLVRFSTAPVLDYLGELVGVKRLPASRAFCTVRLTLNSGHGDIVVPAGLRISSADGKAVFQTVQATEVDSATNVVDVDVECQSEGVIGNGYLPGNISTIMDPQAYLATAANLDTTTGGGDQETDAQLRERIYLAPSSFSVAGPKQAYKFHASSASPLIIDVAVLGPEDGTGPGIVEIYPLVADGTTPQQILDAVYTACNNEKVRPLTDLVNVYAPTLVAYDITVNLVLYATADQAGVVSQVTDNLQAYSDELRTSLGRDVVVSKVIQLSQIDGVYSVAVASPAATIAIDSNKCAVLNTLTVNVTAITNG